MRKHDGYYGWLLGASYLGKMPDGRMIEFETEDEYFDLYDLYAEEPSENC